MLCWMQLQSTAPPTVRAPRPTAPAIHPAPQAKQPGSSELGCPALAANSLVSTCVAHHWTWLHEPVSMGSSIPWPGTLPHWSHVCVWPCGAFLPPPQQLPRWPALPQPCNNTGCDAMFQVLQHCGSDICPLCSCPTGQLCLSPTDFRAQSPVPGVQTKLHDLGLSVG